MTIGSPEIQVRLCRDLGVAPFPTPGHLKLGISVSVKEGKQPLNGLRVHPSNDTSGWYIWAGEWSDSPDFFVPLHISHLAAWSPLAAKYLMLPPGWRFLVAPGVEDIWYDAQLNA